MTVVAPVEVARSTQSPQLAPKIDPHPRQTPGNVPDQAGPTPKQGKNPRTTPLPKPAESSLPEVDVIVAADQAAAVERYMALLRSGTLDTSSLARPDAGEPSELVVAPLEVQPLT